MDVQSLYRFDDYTRAKEVMLQRTHIGEAPWWIVDAVDKRKARLNCIQHFLTQVPYQELPLRPIALPEELLGGGRAAERHRRDACARGLLRRACFLHGGSVVVRVRPGTPRNKRQRPGPTPIYARRATFSETPGLGGQRV